MPISSLAGFDMLQYYVQKQTLEDAIKQLRQLKNWPKLCLVKPGGVATQPNQTSPRPYAEVNHWASILIKMLDAGSDLEIEEIALGVNYP
jgi:hypothetical protein